MFAYPCQNGSELCPRPKARPLVVLVTGEQRALVGRRAVTKAALASFAKVVYYWRAPVVWEGLKGTSLFTLIVCHGGRVSQGTSFWDFEPKSGSLSKMDQKSSRKQMDSNGASFSETIGRSTGLVF